MDVDEIKVRMGFMSISCEKNRIQHEYDEFAAHNLLRYKRPPFVL